MKNYVFDFETTVPKSRDEGTRVWLWCVCDVDDEKQYWWGSNIKTFVRFMELNPATYWAHNAAFDVEFLFYHLIMSGFEYSEKPRNKTFNALISNTRKFYQAKIYFKAGRKGSNVSIIKDSLKKMPQTVERLAKAYHLPYEKGECDYAKPRPIGYRPTLDEIVYCLRDVQIVACCLRTQLGLGLDKLTIGADALAGMKKAIDWAKTFPVLSLELDAEIREAYKGGFCYVDPRAAQAGIVGCGTVYDVHSMYPAQMMRALPVGEPTFYPGRYTGRGKATFQRLTFTARIRPDHIPCLQIKKTAFFRENEYQNVIAEPITLTMTGEELELVNEQYMLDVVSWDGCWVFGMGRGMFDDYINYWYNVKNTSTGAVRENAKLMLNSGYGKLATNPDVTGRTVALGDDMSVIYPMADQEFRDPVYTAAAAYITAYGRSTTIRAAQANYSRYRYSDTDSVHLAGYDAPNAMVVTDGELGTWGIEHKYQQARYPRQKTYMLIEDGKKLVRCAGLAANKRDECELETFKPGMVIPGGKMMQTHVRGGVWLHETDYVMR